MTSKLTKDITTPDGFFEAVPETLAENLEYRINLHSKLAADQGMQKAFIELSWANPKIFYNTCLWVYDPQAPRGERNKPFILWPHQKPVVAEVHKAIVDQYCIAVDKSRKEGASELICKMFLFHWLFSPESQFLVGSRKAEFVDKGVEISGNHLVGLHKSLMHKVCYGLVNLPHWMKPEFLKTYMLLQNKSNGAVISGEATNENFAAGDRQTSILVDEYGRLDHNMALSINDSVHDTSDCVIFNSTHFYGQAHPYNQLITQKLGKIKVLILPWEENPTKNQGLYYSPDYDQIIIHDIEYYRDRCPDVFDSIEPEVPFKWSQLKRDSEDLDGISFVADAGDSNEGGCRSPWYDKECEERRPQDIAQNLDRRPLGVGNAVFTPATLRKIRSSYVRHPSFKGEIKPVKRGDKVCGGTFSEGGKGRLKWWGPLIHGRPDQSHNYIVSCDISLGTGASNSVAAIIDVNTGEVIGMWVCPNTPPESFASQVLALCYWVGGSDNDPYLIWEANGGQGQIFEKEATRNGYGLKHIRRGERDILKRQKNQYGWWNNAETKFDACAGLDLALREGIKKSSPRRSLKVYDEDTIGELESYIYSPTGLPIPATMTEDSSGAHKAHGDRVIALAVGVVAMEYVRKAFKQHIRKPKPGTPAWRYMMAEQEEKEPKRFRIV